MIRAVAKDGAFKQESFDAIQSMAESDVFREAVSDAITTFGVIVEVANNMLSGLRDTLQPCMEVAQEAINAVMDASKKLEPLCANLQPVLEASTTLVNHVEESDFGRDFMEKEREKESINPSRSDIDSPEIKNEARARMLTVFLDKQIKQYWGPKCIEEEKTRRIEFREKYRRLFLVALSLRHRYTKQTTCRLHRGDRRDSDDEGSDISGDSYFSPPYRGTHLSSPVISHPKGNKTIYLNRRVSRCSWRVSRNTCGTQHERRRAV